LRLFLKWSVHIPKAGTSGGVFGWFTALALTALYIYWLFPANFIRGTHPYWGAQNQDITQYIAGFEAYFREPWHWPLWRIESLNWPFGTLTTFVDAIPLYAAILKALAPQTWLNPNPFGYWVALCLLLQASGAWWVLREAQVRSWVALLSLTILLITFPAWLYRMGHISLLSHWLIVFAVALILRGERTKRFPAWAWTALLISALFINIYLFCMVALLCVAPALHRACTKPLAPFLYWALATAAFTGLCIWVFMWPLPAATGQVDFGFGVYSLNLLSPFVGGQWFSHIPNAFSAEQHFEGFNYLGLGLMPLIAIAACIKMGRLILGTHGVSAGMRIGMPPSTNTLLLILLLMMTVYALSNQLYWGSHLIYQWDVPLWAQKITGQLRASGRFFWPVAYALTIYSVILIARSFDAKKRMLIFSSALVLQILDLQPYFAQLNNITPGANPIVIDFTQWQKQLPSQAKTLYFYPKMKCAQHSQAIDTLLPVMRFASHTQRALNTGYLARYNPVCGQERDEIAQSNAAHSAYIFVKAEYLANTITSLFPASWHVQCIPQDFASVCTAVDSTKDKR
jgi:hypothetical protein